MKGLGVVKQGKVGPLGVEHVDKVGKEGAAVTAAPFSAIPLRRSEQARSYIT
jgi:hypothetical protein